MYWPRCHSTNLNGPVPTGLFAYLLFWMSVPAKRCLGRIGDSYPDNAIIMYGAGVSSLNTTVCASGVSTASSALNVLMPRGWNFFSTSMIENWTSALVKGEPSWNLTPSRNLNVIVLPSLLSVHAVARLGTGFRSKLYSKSPS